MEEKMIRKKNFRPLGLGAVLLAALTIHVPVASQSRKSLSDASKTPLSIENAQTEATSIPTSRHREVSLSFKQMGAWSVINLRGVDASRVLSFPVRPDEVVVAAKLSINYDYSPALIPELSHLRILLNDRIVAVEALPSDKGIGNARLFNIDPRLFGSLNDLRFNFIGHYTRQCEDPFHSSLWLTLSDMGRLDLTLAPISSLSDLKYLPLPFFDKRENNSLKLPFVFSQAPSFGTLKAAGVVASWFGLQAGTRGAQFPVLLNTLPDGNAIVFLQGNETLDGIKSTAEPSISIQPHPTNSQAKLLVVTGSNDEDLGRAARAIALFNTTLSGQHVSITQETETALRKPYDAPAWIPIDRPVKFGELARIEELRVQGYYPEVIRLNYRVSPDVFTWRTPGVPMDLKYRATRLPLHNNSSLNINLNATFIQALGLNWPEKDENQLASAKPKGNENNALKQEFLFIPPYAVGGRDQLQFSYYFDVIKGGECQSLPPDNLQGAIDPESTLDFSNFPHYVALPNLAYFANIGFPYTRMADLSETAVVLSRTPNAHEMAAYLMLMGKMGEATGYPVLRHRVVSDADIASVATRDLIVIASAKNQDLMTQWADSLPIVQMGNERRVREPYIAWRPAYRWEQQDVQATPKTKGNLNLTGPGGLTSIMAFQSPLTAGRSVVVLHADKAEDLQKISDALTDPERIPTIQGDFAVFDEKTVRHAQVSETYYVGSLPSLSKLRWFFSDQPMLLAFLGLLISALIAALVYRPLRNILAKRLKK
ncbi:MAG: cellulose biosynthesis cyclic di-GMP-binding regulatory protein BcsB [Hydrogenophaga sp.]|nr:cellulose biosynthesis cyclic di-GMP-binding regulatory protein BcsB [Hydrogenophaga sp.]